MRNFSGFNLESEAIVTDSVPPETAKSLRELQASFALPSSVYSLTVQLLCSYSAWWMFFSKLKLISGCLSSILAPGGLRSFSENATANFSAGQLMCDINFSPA